eukprot:m.946302 g.946302  ORF g.946302 m.946302 type:complete len:201 (+) comp23846_c0_seq19:1225-1827(+)
MRRMRTKQPISSLHFAYKYPPQKHLQPVLQPHEHSTGHHSVVCPVLVDAGRGDSSTGCAAWSFELLVGRTDSDATHTHTHGEGKLRLKMHFSYIYYTRSVHLYKYAPIPDNQCRKCVYKLSTRQTNGIIRRIPYSVPVRKVGWATAMLTGRGGNASWLLVLPQLQRTCPTVATVCGPRPPPKGLTTVQPCDGGGEVTGTR